MTTRIHTARGGAGNVASLHELRSQAASTSTSASSSTSTSTSKYYSSGRGGAGNFHSAEHAIFAFDEELDLQLRHEKRVAPIIHIGRGGAGNTISQNTSARSSPGLSMHRNWSSSTACSVGSGSRTSSEFERDEKIKTKTKTSSSSSSSSDTGLKEPQPSRWARFVGGFRT